MGDPKRNVVFASFIVKQFPKARTFLVVADGKGELARKLANKKKLVTVIEAYPRFEGRDHPRISYREGWFDRGYTIEEDVVVAMHPDEATSEVIRAATRCRISWAVVPCCLKGKDAMGVHSFQRWLAKLIRLGGSTGIRQTLLKIQGKNVVLWRKV